MNLRIRELGIYAGAAVGVVTLLLGIARAVLLPEPPGVVAVLLGAAAGFFATSALAKLNYILAARWLFPSVGLIATGSLAVIDGGLFGDVVYWIPFVPLLAVFLLDGRRSLFFAAGATVTVTGVAVAQLTGIGMERVDPIPLGLRFSSVLGAVSFAAVLGLAYERGRRNASDALERTHNRMQALVGNLQAGVAITDHKGILISINQRLCDVFEFRDPPHALVGSVVWDLIADGGPLEDPARFRELTISHATADTPAVAEIRMKDGTVFERDFMPLDLGGRERAHLWSYHDITAHKAREERLLTRVQTDALTGLASRTHFVDELGRVCARPDPIGILFIDLDGFKAVNDAHGHAAGDHVLREVAERITGSLRHADVAARLGGDEFAVLLEGASALDNVTGVASKIIDAISRPIRLEEREVAVGASVGVVWRACDGDPEQLIEAADAAMYEAKSAGKGSYRVAGEAC